MTSTDELVFTGEVINGRNGHHQLVIPGRNDLQDAPKDWPEKLFPGSLNVLVSSYPVELGQRGLTNSVKVFDTAGFRPALAIPQAKMINNLLAPHQGMPERGKAQVWRATVTSNGKTIGCWVLRRIGSGLAQELELLIRHEEV